MTTTKPPTEEETVTRDKATHDDATNNASEEREAIARFQWGANEDKPQTAQELYAALMGSGVIGVWKDRPEFGDTPEFARELRRRSHMGEEEVIAWTR